MILGQDSSVDWAVFGCRTVKTSYGPLIIQEPVSGPFDQSDLVWEEIVERVQNREQSVHVAWIDSSREQDFLRGEEAYGLTRFNAKQKSQKQKLSDKVTKRSAIRQTLHSCTFGPEDKRTAPQLTQADQVRRSKIAKGESVKRGCQARFQLKEYQYCPGYLEIRYFGIEHVDSEGQSCHAEGSDNFEYVTSPWLTAQCKEEISKGVIMGQTSTQIIDSIQARIIQQVSLKYGVSQEEARSRLMSDAVLERDWLVSKMDIANMGKKLAGSTWRRHSSQAQSIHLWVQDKQSIIVEYQPQMSNAENDKETKPFILSMMSEWQEQQLLVYGNDGPICMDATFGTNNMKVNIPPAPS